MAREKKIICYNLKMKILILAGVFLAGTVGYWLISPLFIDKTIAEKLEDIMIDAAAPEATIITLAEGSFMDADSFHKAKGTVRLIEADGKYFVRFEDNFKVTNGPDLFVHFGKNGAYAGEARISILKGNIGSQNYEVPADIDPFDYGEIWIWCRAFSVPFGHAELVLKENP